MKINKFPVSLIHDILAIAGMCMLGYGLWLVEPFLMFVVIGTLLLLFAIAGGYMNTRAKRK